MHPRSQLVASRLAGHTDDNSMNVMRHALVKALERISELEGMLDEQKDTILLNYRQAYSHADK